EAEREARRSFGNVSRVQEFARDVWWLESVLDDLAGDFRHAWRGLAQRRGFTLAVISTLALGIGANAAAFALINAIVLRPLPYPDSQRIISVSQRGPDGRDGRVLNDLPYEEWTRSTVSLEAHAAYREGQLVVQTPQGPQRIVGLDTTPAYFGIFG